MKGFRFIYFNLENNLEFLKYLKFINLRIETIFNYKIRKQEN